MKDLSEYAENISVVIPVYNKEKFVERCINSVLMQKLLPGEIIVVDDGSIDKSAEIVETQFKGQVTFLKQENQGESQARNNGVNLSSKKWIAFLDADDEWTPNLEIRF